MAVSQARTPSSPALAGESQCPQHHCAILTNFSGIGLETSILFAKEGASVLMSDVSQPALEKAAAKVKQLVPNAARVEILVRHTNTPPCIITVKLTDLPVESRRLQGIRGSGHD